MSLTRGGSFNPFKRAMNDMFDAMERDFAHPFGVIDRVPFGSTSFPGFATGGGRGNWMDLDLKETESTFELSADLPGMSNEDITIDLDRNTNVLTVSGERKQEHEEKEDYADGNRKYHYFERSYGKTSRSIRLPDNADASKANAAYDNGVLRMSVPKRAALPSTRIKVPIADGKGSGGGSVAITENVGNAYAEAASGDM